MYTIKTLNAISPVGAGKAAQEPVRCHGGCRRPGRYSGAQRRPLNTTFNDNLLAIARAGAGVNNIPLDRCSEQGIVVFNTPGANANAVAELVIGMLIAAAATRRRRPVVSGSAGDPAMSKSVEKGKSSSWATRSRARPLRHRSGCHRLPGGKLRHRAGHGGLRLRPLHLH